MLRDPEESRDAAQETFVRAWGAISTYDATQPFGPWMLTGFRLLAKLKGLRGTAFDVFGKTEERRTERALIDEYRASIDEVLGSLNAANLALATEIARLPEEIRGYGHVKDRHLAAARPKWAARMGEWRAGGQQRAA